MSGRTPGRPAKDDAERRREEKLEHKKDIDRIEVERFFSLAKRRSGAGLIRTKLSETTLASIALSVLVANLLQPLSRSLGGVLSQQHSIQVCT